MNRGFCITLTAIIVALAFSSSSCQSKKNDANRASSNLRLISYNVWYGFTKVPDRKLAWIEWMNRQKPDIVSLQELNGYTHEKLAEDARAYGHAYVALLKEEGFPTGITLGFYLK